MGEKQAFNALNAVQKKKVATIFEDIDFDNKHYVDLEKSIRFNKFIDDVEDKIAEKDANAFVRECAICNKTTVNFFNCFLFFFYCFLN